MLQEEQFEDPEIWHVPAHEVLSEFSMWPGDRKGQEEHEAWLRKQQESIDRGLVESVQKHGVINPVLVSAAPYYSPGNPGHGEHVILQGHHRAIAAAMIDPDMKIPIYYTEHTSAWGPHGDVPKNKPIPS